MRYAAGDYAKAYMLLREATAHMWMTGDTLAAAIVKQDPALVFVEPSGRLRATGAALPQARIAPPVLRRRRSTAAPPKPRRRIRKLRLLALLRAPGAAPPTAFTFGFVTALAGEIPKLDPRYQVEAERDGYIYANDGKTSSLCCAATRARDRRSSRDEISPLMKHAIVAIEDQRFYEHHGVDLRGIVRAVWQDITNQRRRCRAARRSRSSS